MAGDSFFAVCLFQIDGLYFGQLYLFVPLREFYQSIFPRKGILVALDSWRGTTQYGFGSVHDFARYSCRGFVAYCRSLGRGTQCD